jgi:catechol 2,3-dioxygenase-like lactoylglutathione lyase family enzyme
VFAPTGWKTVALDHITFEVPDYRKEAAFYVALMGWKLRSDDGKQAVLDIGDWASAILRAAPEQQSAVVKSFCFVIEPWNAKTVEAELRKRGLSPMADDDGHGFESFHVRDPDGWDLQVSNGKGLKESRDESAGSNLAMAAPFAPTGWKTVWIDHLSFRVTNYKESASFYSNLLGWKPTYDEGSQQELMIDEVGDIIVRGGNPRDPKFNRAAPRKAELDHISFGISPWDADAVKAELEKRGLKARVDTAGHGDIHRATYESYHTTTPNGYDLQISFVTRQNRLVLAHAVKPKALGKL